MDMKLKSLLYATLRRILPQDTRNKLKHLSRKTVKRLAPLRRIYHGQFTADQLIEHLDSRLPSGTEVIMLHSSMHDLYPMYNESPEQLADALITYCKTNNLTLCMPAFIFGGKAYDATQLYKQQPLFDAKQTPSETGYMTEYFRKQDGVYRSLHPTHSICAIGPLADVLTRDHHTCGTIFGEGSPFMNMTQYQTVILGLGCAYFRVLTQVHTVEDLLKDAFPYPLDYDRVPMKIRDEKGNEFDYTLIRANNNDRRRVDRIEAYLDQGELSIWRWHGVPLFSVSANAVTNALLQAAKEGITIYEKR